jgi:phosphatidylglycerol:prolipoprotein diacylglycerol transferase
MGPYVHNIDPVIGSIFGIHLWWYGLSYTLGFLNAHLFIKRRAGELGLSLNAVYELSILLAAGVLLGGRLVEVVFYEWPFYREHFHLVPAYWIGGMATHGLLFGGLVGVLIFCRRHGKAFLTLTDALAIPAAFILGVGRIGNFIDGQIVGSMSDVPWAVKFPDADGFRHPVVLYDGAKNLFIIPILWLAARGRPPTGFLTGLFLFLYAFLRIFVDFFREYPTDLLGIATGQVLNILMSVLGLALIIVALTRGHARPGIAPTRSTTASASGSSAGWRPIAFASLLIFSLTLPSDWTQDVPARYGARHPGLSHSSFYPEIDASPKGVTTDARAQRTPDALPKDR